MKLNKFLLGILCVIGAGLLGAANVTHAVDKVTRESCQVKGEALEGVLVVLIDQSDSNALGENFEQTLRVVKESVAPGMRLLAVTIGDRRATSTVLVDIVRPVESMWEPKIAYMKKDRLFKSCVAEVATFARQVGGSTKATAILETLMFVDEIIRAAAAKNRGIVIFSDMIQNSDLVSFYKLTKKDTVSTLLQRVSSEHLLPAFKDVVVRIAGIGGTQSDKQARFAEDFWRAYFEKVQAKLGFYGPTLVN